MRAATNLEDIYKTLSPEPLLSSEELAAYYVRAINEVRGGDKVNRLALGLRRSAGGAFYKAFLMGHPGVGKSTELTRLVQEVTGQYQVIRFSAGRELDSAAFKPFDLLLLMMIVIAERTAKPVPEGAGSTPSDGLLREIMDWFAAETATRTRTAGVGAEASAGLGPDADTWWAKALGLFANLKGEIKYASTRETRVVEYRLNRLSQLIDMVNQLLDDCNRLLREATGKDWLIIGEDFDKPGIPVRQIENLFLANANIFQNLRCHLIFTIPISLGYSAKVGELPFPSDRLYTVPDTPVYTPDHLPHQEGIEAVEEVLRARVDPDLFGEGQQQRLILASGGNLRDLFAMVNRAADSALLRGTGEPRIDSEDTTDAIRNMQMEYERRLGQSPYDEEKIDYGAKAELLRRIYDQDPEAKIPNNCLFSLLRSRAVQEFNREGWFGVHPLVVNILQRQGRIGHAGEGPAPGGAI